MLLKIRGLTKHRRPPGDKSPGYKAALDNSSLNQPDSSGAAL
jgi:hypothetical protein